jgi:hypothetical protein
MKNKFPQRVTTALCAFVACATRHSAGANNRNFSPHLGRNRAPPAHQSEWTCGRCGTIVVGGSEHNYPAQPANGPSGQPVDASSRRSHRRLRNVWAALKVVLAKADICNTSKWAALRRFMPTARATETSSPPTSFCKKVYESVKGVVSYISFSDGYFRINGITNDANTGVMVRSTIPTAVTQLNKVSAASRVRPTVVRTRVSR